MAWAPWTRPSTFRAGQTDQGQEQADTDAGDELDGARDGAGELPAAAEQGQREEDLALDEDSSDEDLVAGPRPVPWKPTTV